MEDKSLFLRTLGENPKLKIIDFLMENRIFDYSQKEIIDGCGISKKSFYANFGDLVALELVWQTRNVGRAKLYKLNGQNPVVKSLLTLEWRLIKENAEKHSSREPAKTIAKASVG